VSKTYVDVKVTDRIGKRFGKTRIDLSISAFRAIANLNIGLINVEVERIK
jgi:rare lipoprotein A (peptidoglycan hydrolase)